MFGGEGYWFETLTVVISYPNFSRPVCFVEKVTGSRLSHCSNIPLVDRVFGGEGYWFKTLERPIC